METSREFYVTEVGLERFIYDSRMREEISIPVHGVHRVGMSLWIWNPVKGPPKSVDDAWLRTEDGQQFLSDMEKSGMDDINFEENELDGPPSDDE